MITTSQPIHDEMIRVLRNADGEPIGRISIALDYVENVEDGIDEGGGMRYVADPVTRINEVYVVKVEGRVGEVQSDVTYTGAAMDTIMEMYERLQPLKPR